MEELLKNASENDIYSRSIKTTKPQFKALLVFSKTDWQSQIWKKSLEQHGIIYDVAHTEVAAYDLFLKTQHHLVVIDTLSKSINAKNLCKNIRGSHIGCFCTIVAVTSRRTEDNSNAESLLTGGFNQLVSVASSIKDVEDVILQLEAGPLNMQWKFRSCQAVFSAMEHSHDLILIADDKFLIQYANQMYQQVTGFIADQVIGEKFSKYFESKENSWQRIRADIHLGKEWSGYGAMKRKDGEELQFHVIILPITGHGGSVHQYVIVSQALPNSVDVPVGKPRKSSFDLNSTSSEPRRPSVTSHDGDGRKSRLAKIHYMSVEAPITQIIKLISGIKESSQPVVSEVLHQILDILRNSELYTPSDLPNRTREPMLMDFVEGLVTGTDFGHTHRRPSGGGISDSGLGRSPPSTAVKAPALPVANPVVAANLAGSEHWHYDILALERITSKKPLEHLGMHILDEFDACEVLGCSPNTLHAWLMAIESKYHSVNPYHNSTHAADVLHATAYFLRKERVKIWMDPVDEISALLAAIIHDVDHPGRTNAFLVNSNNPLALLYNDTAVLESHHAAFAFKFTINNESCNIFKNTSQDVFRSLRQSMIDMVLATELSKHFEHVNKFISVVTKSNNNSLESENLAGSSIGSNPSTSPELKLLIKRIMIKVADVINPARETSLCVEWARRISEEYFSQTDEEKRRDLPVVMPHFDRNTCSLPKSQITFIEYFLTDMCDAWHEFCGMEEIMDCLSDNYNYWKELHERGVTRASEISQS